MEIPSWIKGSSIIPLLMGIIYLWSGIFITLLMLLGLLIWPFRKDWYRKYTGALSYTQWSQFSFLANWWSNADCKLYIEPEDQKYLGNEHTVCMGNHAFEIDWLMAIMMADRHGMMTYSKIYGKEILKYIPIIGWIWYLTESIFLQRNWEKDKKILEKSIGEIVTYPDNCWVTMLLFPEGTRWTPEKHAVCLKIAKEKGYPEYRHVLIPRAKGFYLSMKLMKGKVPSVTDMTVAFPEPEPTFLDAVRGKKIQCAIKVKRYLINDIPSETEEECGNWLRQIYKRKDEDLEEFKRTGKFSGAPIMEIPKKKYDLFCYIFWTVFTAVPVYQYANYVIFYASYLHQIVLVMVLVLMVLMVQWMIRFTQIKHGTSYGLDTKQNVGQKKTN